ncbi:MAG: PASTA domain-containing protein, partial [Acidimicrobiia bacterium]|nr:PASTA domain-containing protein [Acidimicrobiia bacterium]
MNREAEKLAPRVVDAEPVDTGPTRLKQRHLERRKHWSAAALLVFGFVLSIAGLVASCGAGGDTTLANVGDIGSDNGSLNDDGGGYSDSGESSQQQTGDPPEDSGPVEFIRVPDVIGLSSDEATSRLDTAGFAVAYGLQDAPEPGVDHETVTGAYPSPGTLVPFGSPIWLEVYIDDQMDT